MNKKNSRVLAAIVSLAVTTTMFSASAAASDENTFRDVEQGHWAYEAVEEMVNRGVIQGKMDGVYDPNDALTYAQWAKMAVAVAHPDQCFHCTQILGDQWWGGYAGAALDSNLSINGRYLFADTMVHQTYILGGDEEWLEQTMDSGITRYDMARVLYNMATMMGLEDCGDDVSDQISDWENLAHSHMAEAVHFCFANGILEGDDQGAFNGSQVVTRAQAATVLHRLLDAVEAQEASSDSGDDDSSDSSDSKDDSSDSKDDSSSSKDDSSDSKDDSSSSKDDSSDSKDDGDKEEEEPSILDQLWERLMEYLNNLNGNDSNNNSNNNNDPSVFDDEEEDGEEDGEEEDGEEEDKEPSEEDDDDEEDKGDKEPAGNEPESGDEADGENQGGALDE